MRTIFFSVTVIVTTFLVAGCASSFVVSPDSLASQLRASQKGESMQLATTISAQVPNHNDAGSVEKLLCTNQEGDPFWVYTNQNTELHITKRSGDMVSMYFDTVVLDGTKLKGVTSRVQKTEQEIDLSDILKIEVYTVGSKSEPAQSQ